MKANTRITATKAGSNKGTRPRFSTPVRQTSQKVSLNPEIEKLAEEVAVEFGTFCAKLRDLKPKIDKIRSHFRANSRGSVMLAGCRTFREFCEKRLHRCEQTVYKMLNSDTKTRESRKTIPNAPPARRKSVVAREKIERLRSACRAASRYFDAEDKGNKAAAREARAHFFALIKSEPIQALIIGDGRMISKCCCTCHNTSVSTMKNLPSSAVSHYKDRPMAGPPGAAEASVIPAQA